MTAVLGERYYTTPHLHINGRAVAFGRDSDGLWVPMRDLHPEVEDEPDDVEKATDPGDIERICEAISGPMSVAAIATKAAMSVVNVRRLVPVMLRRHTIRPVTVTVGKGHSFTRFELT